MNPCEVNEIGVEQASGWCNGFVSEQDESRTVGWFAFGPAGYREVGDDDDAYGSVSGTRIRLMCDHGVAMPLWDEDGLLPEDTDWIERELGLSRSLIADLTAWAADWDAQTNESGERQAWLDRRTEHEAEAHRLFARLQSEISPRFAVALKL